MTALGALQASAARLRNDDLNEDLARDCACKAWQRCDHAFRALKGISFGDLGRLQDHVRGRCAELAYLQDICIESKHGRISRYGHLEGLEAAAALSRLYTTTRLFVNFFQPSFKLASKRCEGARVRKRYHPPATPCQRLLADPGTPRQAHDRIAELSDRLDPIRLLRQMRARQQRIVDIADQPVAAPSDTDVPPLEQFLAGLRTAWREGEARPTAIPAEIMGAYSSIHAASASALALSTSPAEPVAPKRDWIDSLA